MAAIGIDTHKRTLAACAVDDIGAVIAERTFDCTRAGFVELTMWASTVAPGALIGIEGSASYGAPLAHHLVAAGVPVCEVPPQLSRRERGRSRRPGKSDPGDALAIARVTARERDLPPVRLEDRTTELGLLADARDDLVHAQTRARNRLHAHLVVLLPGYGRTASQLVSGRQLAAIEQALAELTGVRADLARALLAEVRDLGQRAKALELTITTLVSGHPVLGLPGVGSLTAARLVAETGDVGRFRSPAAFAMLAGVAPIPASSGETRRMRLNRGGNRRLNRALYTIALSQAWHHEPAKAYLARKQAAGKSWPEAMRCLKHRVSRPVFRLLQAGQADWAQAA
ncbi:MAG: IS110 family transposase [Candidatus Limnocylindrales bacterium]